MMKTMKKNDIIYLDNSATTQVSKEVYEAMKPYFTSEYFNPDSLYYQAREVKDEVEKVRSLIAETINADPDEIFFTSGGCEANTWAMKIFKDKRYEQILTSPIEHHSILNAANQYFGTENVIYTPLFKGDLIKEILHETDGVSNGRIDMDEFEFLLKRLSIQGISIMHGNNEIGTVQDIELLADVAKEYGIAFHTDAVQTFMHLPIDVEDMGVDMLSASAHKIGGPKGIGFLYIKKSYQDGVRPLICGGQQEQGLRGGTTNAPSIIGFGKAIELNQSANKLLTQENKCDIIESALLNACGVDVMFTGSVTRRLPNHLSMCFRDINGQQLASLLAEKGILCSTGSACSSEQLKLSHVLEAINIPKEFVNGAIRLTVSPDITTQEINRVVETITECVNMLKGQI